MAKIITHESTINLNWYYNKADVDNIRKSIIETIIPKIKHYGCIYGEIKEEVYKYSVVSLSRAAYAINEITLNGGYITCSFRILNTTQGSIVQEITKTHNVLVLKPRITYINGVLHVITFDLSFSDKIHHREKQLDSLLGKYI